MRGLVKSLYYNFKILPFAQALRLPILVSRHTCMYKCKRGCIKFDSGKPRTGSLRVGLTNLNFSYESPSFVSIQGQMVIKGDGCHVFGPGVSLNVWDNATLIVGNNFSVAPHLRMFVSDCIEIGDDNMWSFYNLVMDTDCHSIFNEKDELTNHPQKVKFGNKCWIGAYCKILKGASVPDGSIIGAGSNVTKSLSKSDSIYLGNKLHRTDVRWNNNLL